MQKFVPYEKLSKKKKKEFNQLKRNEWGQLNPVTRKADNPKAYKRKKFHFDPSIDQAEFFY